MLPPGRALEGGKRVGDWTTTQTETRYGCFLPDLTGLARDLSIASLPTGLYQDRAPIPQPGGHKQRPSPDNHHGCAVLLIRHARESGASSGFSGSPLSRGRRTNNNSLHSAVPP